MLFTPMRLFALTQVVRDDVDVDDIDLWLTEEPVETVHKQGIMLGNDWFFAEELLAHTTASSKRGGLRNELFIRYDRSRLGRGVLDEVRVFERLQTGPRLLCIARLRDEVSAGIDRDRFFKARDAHLNNLLARRNGFESDYIALQSGLHAQEDLLRRVEARRKFRDANPARPRVATPINDSHEPADIPRPLAAALNRGGTPEAVRGKGTVPSGSASLVIDAEQAPRREKVPLGERLREGYPTRPARVQRTMRMLGQLLRNPPPVQDHVTSNSIDVSS